MLKIISAPYIKETNLQNLSGVPCIMYAKNVAITLSQMHMQIIRAYLGVRLRGLKVCIIVKKSV